MKSSWNRDHPRVPCFGRWVLNHWATREVLQVTLDAPSTSQEDLMPPWGKSSCWNGFSWRVIAVHEPFYPESRAWFFSSRIIDASILTWASLVAQTVNYLPAEQETQIQPLGHEDPLEKGMATHSSILAWRIPRTEESGRLQSMGSLTNVSQCLDWIQGEFRISSIFLISRNLIKYSTFIFSLSSPSLFFSSIILNLY